MEHVPTVCTIYLTGVFRVKLQNGADITPKSKVRCALLAVIANSPNQSISRARLQTLFWGNSSAKQASGSLRSALFKLHEDFSSIAENLFETHTNHISLSDGHWNVCRDSKEGEFLEGLDLPLKGADEFEDWLREERINLNDFDSIDAFESIDNISKSQQTSAYALGILPIDTNNAVESALANSVIDSLIDSLTQLSLISIFDLRGSTLSSGSLTHPSHAISSVLLKTISYNTGENWVLRITLVEPRSNRVIVVLKPIILEDGDFNVDLSHATELILDAFVNEHKVDLSPNLMPWAALSSLFSLSPDAVNNTEAEIDRLIQNDSAPVLAVLKIFAQIFKQNEGLTEQKIFDLHDLQNALQQVPITDTLRPLCESLIGYSAHMLCAENDVSEYLLNTAFGRAPNLAINLDHLSVLHFARGDLKNAVKYHERCMRFSALSSWRYSYDITGAMISIALGDYRTALRDADRSLMLRPQSIGALRYSMIGFAMNESPESANQIKSRIRSLRPEYDLSGWIESFLRRSDPVFANNVAITLQRLDLI